MMELSKTWQKKSAAYLARAIANSGELDVEKGVLDAVIKGTSGSININGEVESKQLYSTKWKSRHYSHTMMATTPPCHCEGRVAKMP